MKEYLLIILIIVISIPKVEPVDQTKLKPETHCNLEVINAEIAYLATSSSVLDTIFHLNDEEIEKFVSNAEIEKAERDDIMLKFIARLNDVKDMNTTCMLKQSINIKVGDIALYCLARIETLPFYLATGRQNCTEPNISREISLPINFIYYTHYERERLTYTYLKYFYSLDRLDVIERYHYP